MNPKDRKEMNTKIKASIKSLRLRTLPLSLAGVVLGILLAVADYHVGAWTIAFILLTTVCLQITSNLSNELGDVIRGTDTANRQGPQYGLDSGELEIKDMKRLIGLFVGLDIVFGLLMIHASFGNIFSLEGLCLMLLGAAAIMGAIKYTLGRNPYGYRGLGDVFVFIFFGIVSVMGSYFVASHNIGAWFLVLPAAAIGFFSVGVLNVNNIRDMKTDAATRTTVALKLGLHRARIYQTVLVVAGWLAMVAFCQCRIFDPWHYLYALSLPLFVMHLRGVWKLEDRALDSVFPLLVMGTFLFAVLSGIGFTIFLLF